MMRPAPEENFYIGIWVVVEIMQQEVGPIVVGTRNRQVALELTCFRINDIWWHPHGKTSVDKKVFDLWAKHLEKAIDRVRQAGGVARCSLWCGEEDLRLVLWHFRTGRYLRYRGMQQDDEAAGVDEKQYAIKTKGS